MNIRISPYHPEQDYSQLLEVIRGEGEEWRDYLTAAYRLRLAESITYVAFADGELCGYVRSMNDAGFFVWVIDLLVDRRFRGHSIGRLLMERVRQDYPEQEIFVMSDVDAYYTKLGYRKEGSIFKVQ
ncbi:GNAT family N-acetyltransferase [Pontibacter sp. G13]|uniref:GNAT family N-acetyltransferase n=1 Tax=Pontibacter sp. G13 TaxID=3074898 RepID=UPI002889051C|nr:GNAT family N-acetyltransferase [Pontibacter sp. G13]WNJ16902.1 GNAT family N-acetyltransferase [Pontibacter sp. G13]